LQFFFLEAIDLLLNEPAKVRAEDDLCNALLQDFGQLPKGKNTNYDNYGVINVSPPVVPNPYVPTFRIFAYNVTGAETALQEKKKKKKKKKKKGPKRRHRHNRGGHGDKAQCKDEPYRDTWKCNLNESWFSDSDAPSRTNTLWSGLGYAQVSRRLITIASELT
jgi:endopolyphosphatase